MSEDDLTKMLKHEAGISWRDATDKKLLTAAATEIERLSRMLEPFVKAARTQVNLEARAKFLARERLSMWSVLGIQPTELLALTPPTRNPSLPDNGE